MRNSLDKQALGYDGLNVDYSLNSEGTLDQIKKVLRIDIRPEFEHQFIAELNKYSPNRNDDMMLLPKS